jgi:hypothetical protein
MARRTWLDFRVKCAGIDEPNFSTSWVLAVACKWVSEIW